MKNSEDLVTHEYCSSVGQHHGLTVPKGKAQAKKARRIAQNADLRVGSRGSGRIAAQMME